MLKGAKALATPAPPSKERGITSDLSVDEALLLHAAGWEPLDLVVGVAVVSVPVGVWNWGRGSISLASDAHNAAVDQAARLLRGECSKVHGHGVVGVRVDVSVQTHHIDVELVGTAVRPMAGQGGSKDARGTDAALAMPFVSDLSARDFTLLERAGWLPVGLAFGASFVYAPRRSAGTAMKQTRQNVELTNYTEAMYSARESAMEKMQRSALEAGGQGVVQVKITEGPMSFARHAIGFTAWGTAVKLVAEAHQFVQPEVVLPLDDAVVTLRRGEPAQQQPGKGRQTMSGAEAGGEPDWDAWARRFESIDGPDAFAALFAPGGRFCDPVTPWTTDLHKVARDTDAIFPDWNQRVDRIRGGSDWAVFEWTGTGTFHPGEGKAGVPISMTGATVIDVDADGKVTAWRDYLDTNEPTQQITAGFERAMEGG